MITKIEGNKYIIGGTTRNVIEKPVFEPKNSKEESLGYGIYDGSVPDNQNECSARFAIEPGKSTQPMRLLDETYRANRGVLKGEGYILLMLSDQQIVCYPVKKGDKIGFGIGDGSVDCMIADPEGPGLEMIELGEPVFKPSMEEEVKPGDADIPGEFFTIKTLLETGNKTEAFKLLERYQTFTVHPQ